MIEDALKDSMSEWLCGELQYSNGNVLNKILQIEERTRRGGYRSDSSYCICDRDNGHKGGHRFRPMCNDTFNSYIRFYGPFVYAIMNFRFRDCPHKLIKFQNATEFFWR